MVLSWREDKILVATPRLISTKRNFQWGRSVLINFSNHFHLGAHKWKVKFLSPGRLHQDKISFIQKWVWGQHKKTICIKPQGITTYNKCITKVLKSKWFEPGRISTCWRKIVQVRVVLWKTVGDWSFDRLSSGHLLSTLKMTVTEVVKTSVTKSLSQDYTNLDDLPSTRKNLVECRK